VVYLTGNEVRKMKKMVIGLLVLGVLVVWGSFCFILGGGIASPKAKATATAIATPKPTPTRVLNSDEAYFQYMMNVAKNEVIDWWVLLVVIVEVGESDPPVMCTYNTDDLEYMAKQVLYAIERVPQQPRHQLLQEYHGYLLQAMEKHPDTVWYMDKGCASMDAEAMRKALLYGRETLQLIELALNTIAQYERSR